jgi:hypothetical protein
VRHSAKPWPLPAIVMSTLPFSTVDLNTSEIDAIISIFDTLKQTFEVSYDLNFSYDLCTLELFTNRKISVGPTIRNYKQLLLISLSVCPSWLLLRLCPEEQFWVKV